MEEGTEFVGRALVRKHPYKIRIWLAVKAEPLEGDVSDSKAQVTRDAPGILMSGKSAWSSAGSSSELESQALTGTYFRRVFESPQANEAFANFLSMPCTASTLTSV